MPEHRKKGKSGTHKYGRNKIKCAAYKAAGRRRLNKLRKLRFHLTQHPIDHCALAAYSRVR